jgi:tRNA (guanine10-N2)-methyltransferase
LPAQVPKRLYFGREVSMDNARKAVTDYALPKRAYLGPTSMDTEMSLIMCNQSKASAPHQHTCMCFVTKQTSVWFLCT